MPRQLIHKAELLRIISERMTLLPACQDLHILDVVIAAERPQGANWTISGLRGVGDDPDQSACEEALRPFLTDLQHRYDITFKLG